MEHDLRALFGLEGQAAVVTGGTGVLGSVMAAGLARAGARVAILGRRREQADTVVAGILTTGGEAMAVPADVLKTDELAEAREAVLRRWGRVDILVNAAGGNIPAATLSGETTVFDLPAEALRAVVELNLLGTVLPSQVFGAAMAGRVAGMGTEAHPPRGCIVNISSSAAQRPATRVGGYAAAKAAIDNFTCWLAVELARSYGPDLRVNAIAPGFFVADQNRRMLTNDDGSPTERGQTIIAHTPAGRFGDPEDLVSTLVWLCGPGARFVTGAVIPVDGGFGAYSGV